MEETRRLVFPCTNRAEHTEGTDVYDLQGSLPTTALIQSTRPETPSSQQFKTSSQDTLPVVESQVLISNSAAKTGGTNPFRRVIDLGDSWWLEISALICSLVSCGCLLILLFRFNNCLLTEWNESKVSINTVISILAGISRSSLALAISACLAQYKWNWFNKFEQPLVDFDRFDAASRGPYGSCRLMKTIVRRPHWIALGAFATIFLIGYEPFVQALISLEDGLYLTSGNGRADQAPSGNATIRRSSMLDAGAYMKTEVVARPKTSFFYNATNGDPKIFWRYPLGGFLRVEFGMRAPIWSGLSEIASPSNLWPVFTCASGNCSWDPFSSLAICSRCEDISGHLQNKSGFTRFEITAHGSHSVQMMDHPPAVSNQDTGANLNMSGKRHAFTKHEIPAIGLNLSNYNGMPRCDGRGGPCPDTYMTAKLATNPGRTLSFTNYTTMILALQMIEADNTWKKNKTLWEDTKVRAQECSLSFCANVYESTVNDGILNETVISSWTERTPGTFASSNKNDSDYTVHANFTLDFDFEDGDAERSNLQIHIPKDAGVQLSKLHGQTFSITQSAINSMLEIFKEGFKRPQASEDDSDSTNGEFPVLIYPSRGTSDPPSFMFGLGESEDPSALFENLALSLSKWVRDRHSDNSTVNGYVIRTMVVIRVHWVYLTLPAVTLLTGLVFVALSIADTRAMKFPAWKTDALVSLIHGSDKALNEKLNMAVIENKFHETAQLLKVSLRHEDGIQKIGLKNEID
ncbi:hypothetical protein BKA56DRAFT_553352 [Ilyonectria sp. MPI-CAGE-AT-0026]|nr:hypothetical protein BKA56DRAFT_553352 [Ilyonectria sp. MPI-CAGE-AT-0026]